MKKGETKQKYYQKEALRAAEDLGYSQDIIERIKNSENDLEIDRIMRDARSTMAKREAEARRFREYYYGSDVTR